MIKKVVGVSKVDKTLSKIIFYFLGRLSHKVYYESVTDYFKSIFIGIGFIVYIFKEFGDFNLNVNLGGYVPSF